MFVTVPAHGSDDDEDAGGGGGGQEGSGQRHVASNGGGGGLFDIREDTMFVTVPMGGEVDEEEEEEAAGSMDDDDADAALQPAACASPRPAPAGMFDIREDTQFGGLGGTGPGPSPASSSDSLGGGRDCSGSPGPQLGSGARYGAAAQRGKWGFAPGADDTLALTLDDGDTQALLDAASLAAAVPLHRLSEEDEDEERGGSPCCSDNGGDLQHGLAGLRLSDSKENLPVSGEERCAGADRRSLRIPAAAAAAALQPLGEAQCGELGLALEADVAAEAALADAAALHGSSDGDEFAVYAEGSGSPPLMGSPRLQLAGAAEEAEEGFVTPVAAPASSGQAALVDPFSPTFQRRMLGCLEPAVGEVRSCMLAAAAVAGCP